MKEWNRGVERETILSSYGTKVADRTIYTLTTWLMETREWYKDDCYTRPVVIMNYGLKLVLMFKKFKLYLFYNDYESSYTTYINHARWHWFAFGWSSCGRKPECPEETHLSDMVTTWPSHMQTPNIQQKSNSKKNIKKYS